MVLKLSCTLNYLGDFFFNYMISNSIPDTLDRNTKGWEQGISNLFKYKQLDF